MCEGPPATMKEFPVIDLYTSATPNGQKIHMMLEETGLSYNEHWVDLERGEQFDPGFLKISPNNKIPALADSDGPDGGPVAVFESGAILVYLAEKTGQFLPTEPRARLDVAASGSPTVSVDTRPRSAWPPT